MRNHLGEREYQTYAAWLRAVKKIDPQAIVDGNKDIAYAMHADGIKGIGEWTGDVGTIYHANDEAYIPAGF